MNPLVLDIVGAVARWLIQGLGTWMVARHLLTPEQSDTLVSHASEQLMLALPGVLALGWSVWSKYRARLRQTALNSLPPGATETQIRSQMALLRPSDVWRG